MKISRKEFIIRAGAYCGGAYSIIFTAGCSASSGRIIEAVEQNNGEIIIEKSKLKNTGDNLILNIKNFHSKIILIKSGDNAFKALSLMCSHKGCELVAYKNFFECPCHGSEFSIDGEVLKGPASKSLVRFKTKSNNNKTLSILINEYE